MLWKPKVFGGLLILWAVVAFTCEGLIFPEELSETTTDGVGMISCLPREEFQWGNSSETQECLMASAPSEGPFEDPLNGAQKAVFDREEIPVVGDTAFYFSKVSALRRFFREKSVETIVVDQRISVLMNLLSHVVSKLQVDSPLTRLFSIQIAVRK